MEQTEEQCELNLHHLSISTPDLEMKFSEDPSIENEQTVDPYMEPQEGVNWSEELPPEIVILIFKYLDCKSLVKTAMTNSFWYELFNSKDIQKCFKNECKALFEESGLYSATKKYLTQFEDWKHMFIYRPRIR